YAATLGADCPFFIRNKPTFAHGIGDQFEAVELDLSAYEIILIKPKFSVDTADAYRNVIPQKSDFNLRRLADLPIDEWKGRVENDFEKSVFPQYPQIEALKNLLYENGAMYASMSGSGSAVYGIFRHSPANLTRFAPQGTFIYR
ncbi:MAG: 4-(cytidine 5'-diphospho)-2-C-methyl-D-erythritol kinase, partial [Draconibacterium sp.]